MIFIQETKCSMEKIIKVLNKWLIKYDYLEIKVNNSVGGNLTLWDPQKLGILNGEASKNYLSMVCSLIGDKESYMLSNVYGLQRQADKLKLLTSLERLIARYPNIPWMLARDFNMIRSLSEKKEALNSLGRTLEPSKISSRTWGWCIPRL